MNVNSENRQGWFGKGRQLMADILVVDDDPVYRTIVSRRLEAEGYQVLMATDGEEGLRMAREARPLLILSDQTMPGINGRHFCQIIRSDPDLCLTYFILLTAREGMEERIAGLESGADDYLVKPCDNRELLARIRTGLRLRQLQQENIELAQRNTVLAMIVTLNHEINNQLTCITAASESMLLHKAPDDPDTRKLKIIIECARNIANLVAKIRHIPRISLKTYAGNRQMLDLK